MAARVTATSENPSLFRVKVICTQPASSDSAPGNVSRAVLPNLFHLCKQ